MDALTFLRADHESVLGMLEVLYGAPSGTGAEMSGLRTIVTNLIIAESQHEAIEEQFFWPAVRDAVGDGLADEAIAQEQAGKKLLQTLEDKEPGDPEYYDAFAEFVKNEHRALPGCGWQVGAEYPGGVQSNWEFRGFGDGLVARGAQLLQ